MAYEVPSLESSFVCMPAWIASFGWIVEAAIIAGSLYTLFTCSKMFLTLSNALCYEIAVLAIISSVVLICPLQAFVICLYLTIRSCLCSHPTLVLPCRCNRALKRLMEALQITSEDQNTCSRPNPETEKRERRRVPAAMDYVQLPSEAALVESRKRSLQVTEAVGVFR